MAFRPARSISLTTDAAASAPFVYVMATFAPSAARRFAIAAPMPREPPVMSATFPSRFLAIVFLLLLLISLLAFLLTTAGDNSGHPSLAKATAGDATDSRQCTIRVEYLRIVGSPRPRSWTESILQTTLVRVLVRLPDEGGYEQYHWGGTTQL